MLLYISKVLHDELQRRLSEGNEVKRMDALRKVLVINKSNMVLPATSDLYPQADDTKITASVSLMSY